MEIKIKIKSLRLAALVAGFFILLGASGGVSSLTGLLTQQASL